MSDWVRSGLPQSVVAELVAERGAALKRVEELENALRDLYAGALDDSMPGQRLVEWHERYPWADGLMSRSRSGDFVVSPDPTEDAKSAD